MPKTVVILNPAARSERAAGLCRNLEGIVGPEVAVHRTSKEGDARCLASRAVAVEVDGEVICNLPVTFECARQQLRVFAPA